MTTFFMPTWWVDWKNMQKKKFMVDPESRKWSLCVRTKITEAKAFHTFGYQLKNVIKISNNEIAYNF